MCFINDPDEMIVTVKLNLNSHVYEVTGTRNYYQVSPLLPGALDCFKSMTSTKLPQGTQQNWVDSLMDEIKIEEVYTPKKAVCYHKFKAYIGLNESYEYCVYCDEKRPIQE